jgi:hypothetical protein
MNGASPATQNRIVITAVGDTTCSDDAKKTFQNIVNEIPMRIFFWVTRLIRWMHHVLSIYSNRLMD